MVNLFRHHIPAATLLQLLIEAGLFFFAVLVAVKLHRYAAPLSEPAVFGAATVFAVLMVCVNGVCGLYRRDRQLDFVNFVARSIVALFVGFAVAYVAFGAFPYSNMFRDALWFTVLYALAGVVMAHEFLLPLTRTVFPHRILVLGTGAEARAVERCLAEANQPNLRLMGFFAVDHDGPAPAVAPQRIVSRGLAIDEAAWRLGVSEIVVAVREQRGGVLPLEQLLSCRISGVRVTDLAGFFERIRGEVPVESLKASWLI
jgi:FlaA1/EpsC-like NDP-sugar epimerase